MRAVSVTVPDEMAVAGTLEAGQAVDLVATITLNPALAGGETPVGGGTGAADAAPDASASGAPVIAGPTTRTTMQDVTILYRNGTSYILRTDLDTAEKLGQLIAAGAQFMLVLRPDEDDRTAVTRGSTLETLVDEFGFLAPKAPPLDGIPGFDAGGGRATPAPSASP